MTYGLSLLDIPHCLPTPPPRPPAPATVLLPPSALLQILATACYQLPLLHSGPFPLPSTLQAEQFLKTANPIKTSLAEDIKRPRDAPEISLLAQPGLFLRSSHTNLGIHQPASLLQPFLSLSLPTLPSRNQLRATKSGKLSLLPAPIPTPFLGTTPMQIDAQGPHQTFSIRISKGVV